MKGVSGRAVHLTMYWDEQVLSVGSGFIVHLNDEFFLVTARHNLAGRHWETNALLSSRGVEPNRVLLRMQASTPGVLEWSNRELALLDDSGLPIWYEHPTLGRQVDIAALALPNDAAYFIDSFDIDRPSPGAEPVLSAGDDLFVVGFPRGFTPHIGIPVWVRASIASEPGIGYLGLPIYLVDARTTKGHSGSAVVLRPGTNRSVRMADGSVLTTDMDNSWIAGVYTGRVGLTDGEAVEVVTTDGNVARLSRETFDIGIVWNTAAILGTIKGRTRSPSVGDGGRRWEPLEDWGGAFDIDVVAN